MAFFCNTGLNTELLGEQINRKKEDKNERIDFNEMCFCRGRIG